jgi:pyruvate-formate lyase-activating enzyme
VVPFFHTLLREDGANLGSVAGLYYRKDGNVVHNELDTPLCDLDTLPYWDDRLCAIHFEHPEESWSSSNYFMPIDAGRGCPYNCTFCCTSHFWRRTYRLKSPDRIVADIRHYKEKYGIRTFWFSHDAFTINRNLVAQVCDRILEEGLDIKWRCSSRIDCVNEDLLLKMKESGLVEIELGIETGSKRMQKLTNKNLDLERAKRIIAFMLKNGIRVSLFFMYGFPEETEEDLADTLSLLFDFVDSGVQHVGMSFTRFNPATDITERFGEQLVFDPDMKILARGFTFGYEEELDTIRNNREIFPFFFHLNTPVRNEYQYLHFLVRLYQQFPKTIRHLRGLYKGDNLKFYRDFYNNNLPYFERDMLYTAQGIKVHALDMLSNTIKDFDLPYIAQLKALLRFEFNANQVDQAENGMSIREIYDFNYIDFKMQLPIEMYCDGKTEILMENKNGEFSMQVLQIM